MRIQDFSCIAIRFGHRFSRQPRRTASELMTDGSPIKGSVAPAVRMEFADLEVRKPHHTGVKVMRVWLLVAWALGVPQRPEDDNRHSRRASRQCRA
jgi:hypothetical protein